MKTLIRPQLKTTIAISRNQKYKKNLQVRKGYFNAAKLLFHFKYIILFSNLFIFLLVPDSPELHSDLCNRYNSQEACNVW